MLEIDSILQISSDAEFERCALEVFRFQARECEPYRRYVELLGVDVEAVQSVEDIPFLPVELFKSEAVYCGKGEPEKIFTSSNTGSTTPSRHMMQSLDVYRKTFTAAFEHFYGAVEGWSIYGLLPNYLEREGSSLVYMVDKLIERCGSGGFYLYDYEKLIADMASDPRPKILLGVSYALWDLAEKYAPQLSDTVVMETGGMKGQRKELPKAVRDAAQEGNDDKFIFTLHKPSLIPFLTYSQNRELREKIYKAYLNRGNNENKHDNKAIINDMIRLRIEKANLLGYKSYADYVTSEQMAGSPKAVYELLEGIFTQANEKAKEELAEMEKMFKRDHTESDAKFESWDWWYYAEKVRKEKYQLDEDAVRQYLSFDNVRNGMFTLANRLYKVTFRPMAAPRYHEECTVYEVIDVDNTHLGVLYLDPFPRSTKSGGAWCGNFSEQRYVNGVRRAPVVGVVCNFTPPVGDTPSLLTFDEAETLFHEFGHALHCLFADVKYRGLAEVEGDFVELPSQIMENWAFEPEILKTYATHYRTGEVIPDQLIRKIQRASLFNQGFVTTELTAAALIDMDIHSLEKMPKDFDVVKFENDNLAGRRGLFPEIAPRYRYTYFAHIFNGGYSSGYYFYLWAEVLDKDAFAAFKERRDICDKELAHSFRYDLLAQGGQKPGMDMYRTFRGAAPDKKPMLRARGLWKEPVVVEPAIETPETRPEAVTTTPHRPMPRPSIEAKGQKPALTPAMAKKTPMKVQEGK